MVNHSFAEKVVTTTKGCSDCGHQILDPGVHRLLQFFAFKVLKSKSKNVWDFSGDITIDLNDPLIDQIFLSLEFYFNGF